MPKQLNVNLAFTADTAKASQGIKSLQQQLTQLMNTANINSNSLGLTKEIKEATAAAAQLKTTLNSSMNANGTLDLTKFNDSLKASNMSLEQYRLKLSALGSEGTQAFAQLASQISSAEIPLKRSNALLQEMGTTLMNTARWQLSSSLLHGFIGGLQHAYGYAQDLNESLNNIRIVTGQSTEQMAQLAQKANQAAKELSTRTTDYTNASLIYYQQGLDDKAVEARTRTTLKLANVTRQSAEEVSNQMTAIWNNFDNGTKSLEYYADAITALGAKTASSSSEIAEGLSKFAAVADTIGLSYETATSALATVVAETRQSADTVGNAFKSIFSRLQSLKLGETLEDGVGLTKYSQALEKVGVQVLDINGELRKADDIMFDLGNRWTEISDTQKTALAQTVAGQRQYAQFVALFDNWGKVQDNIGIAEGSEGTLQKQADIYAESWEASAKRVQASAEAIYDALISDDFFIGFNNVISKILDSVNNLIQGLGGLKGTLTTIGTLLTTAFSQQIASRISSMARDIAATSKKGIAEARAQQTQAIEQLKAQADTQTGSGQVAETQKTALNSQASLQQTLLDNQSKYNAEQLETAQHILDQNSSLREQAQLAAQLAEKATQKADNEQRRFLRDFGTEQAYLDENEEVNNVPIEQYVEQLKICNEEQSAVANGATTLGGVLAGTFESPEQKAEVFTTQMDKLSQSVAKLGSIPELSQFASEVEIAMDVFRQDPSEANMQDVIQRLRELADAASETGNQIEDDLVEGLTNAGNESERVSKRVTEMVNSFKQAGESTADLTNKTQAMKSGAEAGAESLNRMGSESMKASQMITGISSDIMLLASVINTVKSTIDILNNEDLTFAEKMMKIIPALLMTTAMLARTLTGMGGAALVAAAGHLPLIGTYISEAAAAAGATTTTLSLGAAIKVAMPLLAGIGVAIAGVVAIVGAVVKALDGAFETPAERAERLQKEVENTTTAFEKATTAAEELKTTFDEYTTARDALDNCKQGTEEWYNALNDVNDKVLELLDKYPQLAQYLTFGENGELGFSEEGINAVQKEQSDNAISALVAKNEAALAQKQNDTDTERGELIEAYKEKLYAMGDEIYAIIGAKGEEIGDSVEEVAENLADGKISLKNVVKDFEDIEDSDIDTLIKDKVVELVNSGADFLDDLKGQAPTEEEIRGMSSDYLLESLGHKYSSVVDQGNEEYAGLTPEQIQKALIAEEQGERDAVRSQWTDVQGAQTKYQTSLVELANIQEAYSKSVGEQIIRQNEELKNNPYFDKIQAMSGKLFNQNYENQKEQYQSTDTQTLGEDFIKYVQDNNVAGFYGNLKATENGVEYEDENGDSQTASRTQMIAAMAAAEAITTMGDAASKVAKKFEELETSENKADKAMSDFLSTGKIERNGNALKEEWKSQKGVTDRDNALFLLDEKLGGKKDGIIRDTTAQKYGFNTASEMVDAFLEGMKQYDLDVAEARNTGSEFLNKYYQNIVDGAKDSVDDLDLSDQVKIGDLLKQALDSGGYDGLKAMQDVLMNTSDLQGIIEGLTGDGINWASLSLEEFKDRLASLGVQIEDIKTDSLEDLFRTLKQIGEISFESATSTFKSLHEVVDGLKQGDTIKAEDYETLMSKMDPQQLEEFFTPMADGTYKLIGDAEIFYDTVNKLSVEEFKQGWQQETAKAKTAKELQSEDAYGSNGQGKKTIDFGENGTREVGLFDSAYGKTSTGAYGFSKTLVEDQLTYLNLLNLTEEEYDQIKTIEADLRDGKGLEEEQLENLNTLMQNHKSQWEEVAEAQTTAEKNSENYIKMMASSAPDLQSLKTMFDQGDFEETGKGWKDIAEIWKNIFPEEDIQNNIKTLDDFKKSIEEVDGAPAAITDSSRAWHELKDSIKLTLDDLESFTEMKDDISPEDFAEGIKQIAASASNIEELNSVMAIGEDLGIDFTDQIISLLNQSDMTTEEHIKAIIDQLKQGHGEASKLAAEISKLSAENDNEQTAQEAQAERQANYDTAKAANSSERNRIMTSAQGRPSENDQARLNELDEADRAIDIQSGLDDINAAASHADDMFATDQLEMFEQGLDKIGSKADLTAMQIREIGQAAISIVSGSELISTAEQLSTIKDAFSNADGAIDPENLKIYADSIKDIVLNADDLTLDEKFNTLKQELVDAEVPLEYIDEELVSLILDSEKLSLEEKLAKIKAQGLDLKENLSEVNTLINEILGNENSSTIEKLQQLQDLLDAGADRSEINKAKADVIMGDDTQDIMEKQRTLNSAVEINSEGAGVAALASPTEQDIANMQAYSDAVEIYKNAMEGLSGSDFSSMDQLRDFASNIPEIAELQDAFSEDQKILEYASGIDRCAEAVKAYNAALMQGKDTSDALFDMDYLSRVEDAANLYDIDADRVQAMAEAYQDQKDVLNDNGNSLLGLVDVEGDAEESAKRLAEASVDAATRFVRFNDAIEDLRKNGSKLESTLKEIGDNAKKSGKSVKEIAAGTQDYSDAMKSGKKIMSDLLGVETKMMKDDLVTKHFDKAVKAAEKGGDAMEDFTKELRDDYIKSLGEDIDMSNLSDGVKEALNGQDIQSAMSDFMNNLAQLSEGDPIDINNEPFLQALIESQLAAGATADDIESMLSGMGIDADVEPFMGSMADLENSAAAAADSTAQSGDAIVGNMSFDAQANSLTVSNADVKEDVGFDVERTGPVSIPVSIPNFISGGALDYGEGGKSKIYKVQVSGYTSGTGEVYGYKAVPHTETETEEKDQTITGVKISNAHKSAGGKTSAGNSGGSGGSKGGGKGGGCFVAGTPITTSHGFKNIEDIKVGDMVLSYNQKTKQNEYSEVVNTIIHFVHEEIYTLTIENEKIVTTGIHKFLVIREKQIRWVHAHDLIVGDLVLFANGTLHKISNIDIKIEFKTVYNFTVSNNHNYYVGIKQVLAHNRGKGGGSGSRGKEARMVTRRGVSAEHVDPVQERYHVVTKNLDTLAKKLSDVSSAKDRAFGTKRVDYIEKETKALQAEINKMQEYKKEIDDYYKKDVATLKEGNSNLTYTQSNLQGIPANKKVAVTKNGKVVKDKNGKTKYKTVKDWTLKENEQIAKVDSSKYNIKSLLGYDPRIDEAGGAITNIDKIRTDAAKVLNDFYSKEWTKHKEDSDLDISKFKENGKINEKKWKAAIEQESALRNKKAQLEAWYESLEEDFANFYDSLERKQQEATDEINKHIELLQSRLEHTVYAVELKIEIDDSAINVIQSKIDSLGGKARTAAERITELGNIMRKIGGATENTITQDENKNTKYKKANKITANEWGFANVLNNVANNDNTYGIVDNNGDTQYFNKAGLTDKSQYLNGNAILQDFKTNGKAATDSINTLVSSNILKQNSELIEQLNTFAQNELEYVQEIKDYRTQIMDIMAATWEEYSEDMDSIIVKQEHLNSLMSGYYNVIDLVGRSRFYQDANKGRQMEAKLDTQLKAQANQSLANIKKEKETIQALIGEKTDEKSIAGRRENASNKVAEYDKKIAQATTAAEKESLRRSKEEWAQQLDSYDNILKSMQDKLRETEENEQAAFENALQTNLDTFERALKRASETFSDAMAKNVGDLDYLQEYLEMQQQISDQTVASYEKAHQLRQMELEAQKSIEKATDPKIKRELLAIQDEITQKAVDGKEATEYELKFLRQKLELKQAEAALEEAQKAKTQVSLTRDNEGNFGYVYTADDSAVADAEKNYSDKIYEMQRDNQEYIQNLSAQLLQAEMDYQQKMEEISLSELDDTTKKARLEEVDAQFNTLHQSLTDQMTNALNASQDIFGEYSNNYASITGDLMATNLTHIESFQQTEYAVKTGYESMTEYVNAWADNHAKYLEQCEGALTDYDTATKATFKAIGVTYEEGSTAMETYADNMVTEAGRITTALGQGTEEEPGLAAQLGELGSTAEQTFEDMLTSVTGIEEGFVGSLGAMQEAAENLAEAILEVQEQLSALEEQSDTLQAITGSGGNGPGGNGPGSGGDPGKNSDKSSITIGRRTKKNKKGRTVRTRNKTFTRIGRRTRLRTAQVNAILNSKKANRNISRNLKREIRSKLKDARIRYDAGKISRKRYERIKQNQAKKKVKALLNKYQSVTVRFDTGGYTGDWNSNDGRIAMVHQKELILNQQDTQNILGAVGMIRDISNKIDLNALASSGAFSKIGAAGVGNFNNELEQHVQIEANFPNATSREEIQAAFENLIGLASQYANRS